MTPVIIIGIIIFIIIVVAKKKKPLAPTPIGISSTQRSEKSSNGSLPRTNPINASPQVATSNLTSSSYDESIIDVTGETFTIYTEATLTKYEPGVPAWAHHYVYSHFEIDSATEAQRTFYTIFRSKFFRGIYLALEGNTNYAFILLFDLLAQYETHQDLSKLEGHIHVLGQCYPKTKSYGISFLNEKRKVTGLNGSLSQPFVPSGSGYYNNFQQYDDWKLGNKYKAKLNLTDEDVSLLNKVTHPENNFWAIQFCKFEIIRIFLLTVEKLSNRYQFEDTTLIEQFKAVADVVAKKQFKYRPGSNNYKNCIEVVTSEFYDYILKQSENFIREHYGHKRKLSVDLSFNSPEAIKIFQEKILTKVIGIHLSLKSDILLPDETTEIELNSQNTNRWKIAFDDIALKNSDNAEQFMLDIISLGLLNKKNPSVENIFFEASKFISKVDPQIALKLYVYYIHYDLNSTTFDNKQLTKTIQKVLFKSEEQLRDFEIIVNELVKDRNLEKALEKIPEVYGRKRKKIVINPIDVAAVQQEHSGTVDKLNQILGDDSDVDEDSAFDNKSIGGEFRIEITPQSSEVPNSIYLSDLSFSETHIATLDFFAKNNFSILQLDLETFAKSKGALRNQLINSINETCFEYLDDNLIEEEDELYTISEDYYQKILSK